MEDDIDSLSISDAHKNFVLSQMYPLPYSLTKPIEIQAEQSVQYQSMSKQSGTNSMNQLNKGELRPTEEELDYQFRTCCIHNSFVVAGRFDTYLLTQKRQRPLRCVLHAFFQQKHFGEKLAVAGTQNGYVVASVAPSRDSINLYRGFAFDRQVRLKDGRKTVSGLKDIVIDNDGQLWALSRHGQLFFLGRSTTIHTRIPVSSLTSFCITQDGQTLLVDSPGEGLFFFEVKDEVGATVSLLTETENTRPPGSQITRFCVQEDGNIDIFWRGQDGLVQVALSLIHI